MSAKKIAKLLTQALLHDGAMAYALYEYELVERLDDLKISMVQDQDDFIFTVTENSGDVAMVLLEPDGQIHINEEARERLKILWLEAYESNLKKLIPDFAKQLNTDTLPLYGVITIS